MQLTAGEWMSLIGLLIVIFGFIINLLLKVGKNTNKIESHDNDIKELKETKADKDVLGLIHEDVKFIKEHIINNSLKY